MRRPAIFALLFWSVLLLTCVSYAFSLNGEERRFGFLPVVLALAVLVAAWMALPWNPRAGRPRKAVAPAFLLAVLAVGYVTGSLWTVGLYAIPFANGVFLFGFGWSIAYCLAVLPVVFAHYLLFLSIAFHRRGGAVATSLLTTALWVPVAAFVVGVCAAIIEADRRREEAQSLLSELGAAHAELGAAHAKLARRAERVRELAVAEERARMAREIHDSVGHHLTVVNLQLENALRLEGKRPEQAREQVRGAKRFTLEALSEVRRSVRALKPPALEEGGGAGALAALARSFEGAGPEVRFAIEDELVFGGLRAGAKGYLLKDTPPEELVAAIGRVSRGEDVLGAPALSKVVSEIRRGPVPSEGRNRPRSASRSDDALSEREAEVLGLVGGGATNAEIARRLFITEGTAKNHVHKVLRKLGLRDRTELAIYAVEHGYAARSHGAY